MIVTIITHETRHESLRRTVQSVTDASLPPPDVFTQLERPSHLMNRVQAFRCLSLAYRREADLLFLEDDVTLDSGAAPAIAAAQETGEIVTLFLGKRYFLPERVQEEADAARENGTPIPGRLLPVCRFDHWFGTQALYIPHHHVLGMLEQWGTYPLIAFDQPTRGTPLTLEAPFDTFVHDYIKHHTGGLLAAFPTPAAHWNEPTLVPKPQRAIGNPFALLDARWP